METTTKPRVSVVITTYNRPQYLGEAIQSVLDQHFADFELIIVNDNPSDTKTDEVVRAYADDRIQYIKNKKNLGGTKSLNVGLHAARGEYVAILDDDDMWASPEKLEHQVRYLDEHKDVVAVGTNMIVIDPAGREIGKRQYLTSDTEIKRNFFRANSIAHSAVLYRKAVARSVGGYDESLPRGKDYDLWLRIGTKGKLAVIPEYFVKYRKDYPNVKKRLADMKATSRVMWRHRNKYPHFWIPYLLAQVYCVIFRVLTFFPFLYQIYRKIKDSTPISSR